MACTWYILLIFIKTKKKIVQQNEKQLIRLPEVQEYLLKCKMHIKKKTVSKYHTSPNVLILRTGDQSL